MLKIRSEYQALEYLSSTAIVQPLLRLKYPDAWYAVLHKPIYTGIAPLPRHRS